MIVGICKLDLRIRGCGSLKEKRQVLRKIKDRVASRLNVTVAEVGNQDLWQRAEMGFAVVGNDSRVLEGLMERTCNFIEELDLSETLDRYTEIIHI